MDLLRAVRSDLIAPGLTEGAVRKPQRLGGHTNSTSMFSSTEISVGNGMWYLLGGSGTRR